MALLRSSFEGDVVDYYDFFYLPEDKIDKECSYIIDLLRSKGCNFGTLIDVGCGTGAYGAAMLQFFERVVGVDISSDMIEYATRNHKEYNLFFI